MVSLTPWLVCPKPRLSATRRLVCFPFAGGGGSAFRNWIDSFNSDIEVHWIQLPGRENRLRDVPFTSMEELVPALTKAVFGTVADRAVDPPFAFYGHSLGARVAFEVARSLRRQGLPQPCHLFVGASQAPHLAWPHPHLHDLKESDFIEEIQKRYGGVPRQILEDPELRALLIPVLRADIRIMEKYQYRAEPPLDCAITAFGGAADRTVSRSALEAWEGQTQAGFRLHMVEGSHFFLQTARQVPQTIGAELSPSPSAATNGLARAGGYVEVAGL
jgi:medium-chain acyl-[acyl-carrier-protein] hydrolase